MSQTRVKASEVNAFQVAKGIAPHMQGWFVTTYRDYAPSDRAVLRKQADKEAEIVLSMDRYEGRLKVYGRYPTLDGQQLVWHLTREAPHITVDPVRALAKPQAVAGDIIRRLLADYLKLLAACKERRVAMAAEKRQLMANEARIARLLGTQKCGNNKFYWVAPGEEDNRVHLTVSVDARGEVEAEIRHLNLQQIEQILRPIL